MLLFEPQAPGAVQVVVRVGAEGNHRLGAGDAGDLGYLLGDYLGEALEVGDTDHHYEVVGAGHGVGLGDALDAQHRLGGLLDPLPLRSHEHDRRYHPCPPLHPKGNRPGEGVVVRVLLVLDGAGLDGHLRGLVQLARKDAPPPRVARPAGPHLADGLRPRLALGPRVEDDLNIDTRLWRLAPVLDGDEENRLVGTRQDDVPVLVEGLPRHLYREDRDAVPGVRVVAGGAGRLRRDVEAGLLVVHKGLRLAQVALVALLVGLLEGFLDLREVVVPDDAVADAEIFYRRGERTLETLGVAGPFRELLRRPGPDAQGADQVVVGVVEAGGHFPVGQCLDVLGVGLLGHAVQGPRVEPRRVTVRPLQGALQPLVAHVRRGAQLAVRVGDVLAHLGRLLSRHAPPGDEEDETERRHLAQDRSEHRKTGRG